MHTLIPDWWLQLPEFKVQYRSHSHGWAKGAFEQCDLTIWISGGRCRILTRISATSKPKWVSCTLHANAIDHSDPPSLEADPSENIITQSKVKGCEGSLLLRTNSKIVVGTEREQQKGKNGHEIATTAIPSEEGKPLTQDYKFDKREEMDRFAKLLWAFVNVR